MKLNTLLLGVAVLAAPAANPARSSVRCDDGRGLWTRFATASAVVLARCEPMDGVGTATCTITRTWKGDIGPTLKVTWHPSVASLVPADRGSLILFSLGRTADPRTILGAERFGFLVVPPEEVDTLARYLDTYVRLDAMKDPVARNVVYWQAIAEWLAVDDPFIYKEVARDLTGGLSPWGDRIPDVQMAADMALAAKDPHVKPRFVSMVVQGARLDPSDHNQAQVIRLIEGDPGFARTILRDYALARFLRDELLLRAVARLARGEEGTDPVTVEAARRVMDAIKP